MDLCDCLLSYIRVLEECEISSVEILRNEVISFDGLLIFAPLQAGCEVHNVVFRPIRGDNIVEYHKTNREITSDIDRESTRISTEP